MADLIERAEVINALLTKAPFHDSVRISMDIIRELPQADTEQHAHWITQKMEICHYVLIVWKTVLFIRYLTLKQKQVKQLLR